MMNQISAVGIEHSRPLRVTQKAGATPFLWACFHDMALSRKWFWLFLALFALMVEASALADQGKQATLPELVTEVFDTLSLEQEAGYQLPVVDLPAFDVSSERQMMHLAQTFRVWQSEGERRVQRTRRHRRLCIDLR